ncbi:hypothetical protein ASPBRDRAFT_614668 [Aspergillus brasiliensis CBS 101740]|uniref:Uncharacterized protein n=1 Tax=Aspergillus brasiliensis (strain CBS 101740 / IMI 381727 / IBT 21946) TaxID=767769 RepID=A0A1L9UIJ6_ASPBC|nr:hypothetical protein ASPBRDRAFT_614668 [Aspergillus brasiliensis CBS 101740]
MQRQEGRHDYLLALIVLPSQAVYLARSTGTRLIWTILCPQPYVKHYWQVRDTNCIIERSCPCGPFHTLLRDRRHTLQLRVPWDPIPLLPSTSDRLCLDPMGSFRVPDNQEQTFTICIPQPHYHPHKQSTMQLHPNVQVRCTHCSGLDQQYIQAPARHVETKMRQTGNKVKVAKGSG